MYRLNDIVDAFKPIVGWEPDGEDIAEVLSQSESGLYFQEAHPMLTLRAMRAIMPTDFVEKHYKPWDADTTYQKGAKVRYSANNATKVWLSTQGENTDVPGQSDAWEEFNPLSDFLEKKTVASIKKVVTKFIESKVEGLETRNLLDRRTLFDGAGRLNDRIQGTNRICGFEIVPLRSGGITMKLEKIGMQFTGNTGDITFYLFHSSKSEPVWSQTFNYNKTNGTFMWFDLADVFLPYISDDTNSGGSWYLVYNQRELPAYMEAINFARDWSREPCATCNKGNVQLYREMTKYVQISPFCVDVEEDWEPALWDIQDNIYTNTQNYGINLQFSIGCDLTDFMTSQRNIFASVVQKQVTTDCLRALVLNPDVQVNRVQANAGRDDILYELDGNGQGIKGLQGELDKAYKALSFDTRGIDRVCLTCHNRGIRIGAI